MASPPPVFAAGALYDNLLQVALRRFFARATFETEPIPSESSHGRLGIEPTADPAALSIRWFGFRHVLRVPEALPFTPDEVRLARAIGEVLAARYHAIFDPRLMAQRGDLFQGSIEDRYVGAFLESMPYRIEATRARADQIASAIEVLRVAALSSYENRPISSGVLLLDSDVDPVWPQHHMPPDAHRYSERLTGIKSFYRLCDGTHTVFLVNRQGVILDIVDIDRWAAEATGDGTLPVPCARAYHAHARATHGNSHVCIVLSPSHEIKVFANGSQVFTFRNAAWRLLDIQSKYENWSRTVGNQLLAEQLFQAALDLSDERHGALFVIVRDPGQAVPQLIAPADRLAEGMLPVDAPDSSPSRRDLIYLLRDRAITSLDAPVLHALARIDGAIVCDPTGHLLAAGAILLHPAVPDGLTEWVSEGARTTAAIAACRFGPVLKVSEDGAITFYDRQKIWEF